MTHYTKQISLKKIRNQKYLIFMSFPFVLWVILFKYVPLWGWTMAFQDYKYNLTFSAQKWVGLKNFMDLFSDERFYLALRNTVVMSLMSITMGFVIPIFFALMLNELNNSFFKKTVQTISYLPHFVSWVIVAGIVSKMLSVDGGAINSLLMFLGIIEKPILFMAHPKLFWWIVFLSNVWKETGWNAIIYLAAINSISPELYEAAKVDGANRLRQMRHITLPGIRPTIIVLFVLSIGGLLNIGFEQQFLLGNPIVSKYSEVLDLYILNYGIGLGRLSYGTAIGMFKSLVSIGLLFLANYGVKKIGWSTI